VPWIEELTGLYPTHPNSREWYAQMVAFPLPACDAAAPKRRPYDEYRAEMSILSWNGRQRVRVSVQGYKMEGDIGTWVRGLEALLPQGRCGEG
jgi:hypothetical protein